MKTTICPICGYDELEYPINEFDICPCCLCEFGVSDEEWSEVELRNDWVSHGALWAWESYDIPQPANWNARKQFENLKQPQAETKSFVLVSNTQTYKLPSINKMNSSDIRWKIVKTAFTFNLNIVQHAIIPINTQVGAG